MTEGMTADAAMNARIIGPGMIDFNGFFRPTALAAERPLDDPLQLGQPAVLSTTAGAGAPLFRGRRRHARGRRLSLAPGPLAPADPDRAARAERIERRALHARPRRESVRARYERGAPEPAQLRRHGAPVGGTVPLRADRRRRARRARAHPRRRVAVNRGGGLFARRQPRAEAGRSGTVPPT